MGCYFTTITTIIAFVVAIKLLFKFIAGWAWDRSATCLVGKTAIVTGSNTGIGFYTAQDFAKRGARVILACRDKNKADEARKRIIKATGNSNVFVRIVDLASLASVRAFAKEINHTEERLDILVNNAGAGVLGDVTTADGLNALMQSNYFGPFLLTLLLVDLLKKSAPSRIVNVASTASAVAKLNFDNLNEFPKHYFGYVRHYANSKLCNILFTNELARKLKGSGVVANSLHPGAIATELWRIAPTLLRFAVQISERVLFRNTEEGAQTTIYVAVSQELEGVTGEFFDNCKIPWFPWIPSITRDEGLAKKLWEQTEELVKLTPKERLL